MFNHFKLLVSNVKTRSPIAYSRFIYVSTIVITIKIKGHFFFLFPRKTPSKVRILKLEIPFSLLAVFFSTVKLFHNHKHGCVRKFVPVHGAVIRTMVFEYYF